MEKECEKEQYEKAINAYNIHVSKYKEWMHLYSIFTGAFFIGYYNVIDKNNFLSMVIIIAGLITSICWLGSFLGHYSWMKSWVHILHQRERDYLSDENKKYRIYSIVDKKSIEKHGYSTQKITQYFIITIIVGWVTLCINQIYEIREKDECADYWVWIGILLMTILFLLVLLVRKTLFSNVDFMDDLEESKTTKEQ